jgi:hypothetical protein
MGLGEVQQPLRQRSHVPANLTGIGQAPDESICLLTNETLTCERSTTQASQSNVQSEVFLALKQTYTV